MLFNSWEFLVLLAVTLCGTFTLARYTEQKWSLTWLLLCSIIFYGWFNPVYVLLLGGSILANYWIGESILKHEQKGKKWLIFGVTFNLSLLGWFKYANFIVDTANSTGITNIHLNNILLPIGISFFTFQQIAYLMDCRSGIAHRSSLLKYSLFVTYFPQLIAGPIVHPNAILPQLENKDALRLRIDRLFDGIAIFMLGLGKKVILADALGAWASEGFGAAAAGTELTLIEAWGAILCYTLQIYFDFSGYSDMAIGLGRMVGISLPINFDSPYKATSIVDFWRRWHITLSTFLKDYLYIPLGGNRKGKTRRWINLFLTMLLGGLWHGAGWTFIIWGGIHGLLLAVNHMWMDIRRRLPFLNRSFGYPGSLIAWGCTMLSVMVAWVFFRAEDTECAISILRGMIGLHGICLPVEMKEAFGFMDGIVEWTNGLPNFAGGSRTGLASAFGMLLLGFLIATLAKPLHNISPKSRMLLLIPVGALALQKVFISTAPSEFLYFQF